MKIKLPHSTQNWLSIGGATIAIISFFMIVFLFVVSAFLDRGSSYLGLITYILLPAILVAGLILIPVGMLLKKRRIKEPEETHDLKWPRIDFNDQRHRNAFVIFSVGTTIFLFLSAVGSYEAFHFTESDEFCGTICHTVMKPEYTAYQNSPHSRVGCVECHVGSGADWYVKSKLSGLYQVYSVLAEAYPKPISTPIENLRPARETCEQCHWPEKFYDRKVRSMKHYLSDEQNTEWKIDLVLKIGGEHSAKGLEEGVHWHINKDVKIEYKARDHKRLDIPWVKYTDLASGETYIYEDEDDPLDEMEMDSLEVRTMDCMDCHNRPSHNYNPPAFFVNNAIAGGTIPKQLPEIKMLSMEICAETFTSTDSAMMYIENTIKEYYADYYPEITDTNSALIDQAVKGLQEEYSKNIFPEMNVKWDEYPNHIGHVEFDGCFRCHDDLHTTEEGKYIQKDCNQCHFIVGQGTPDSLQYASLDDYLEFQHPTDIDGVWQEFLCTDCHTGLNP
ncbi:MAG: NapC/NirT family cytochrome c [Melioribacteraceae bacterium]|nr:NapC/NirT family cytochrome c [Melioribacteraceae bacterium]MCF8353014.1 NapC/NirT family cytochrome c [Melioribacteraceae bacterium]MCF8392905.1 NapC/NirT family cytochrome c [Melioribacteraceae bacterium]MCF8417801.1 NapC/NirT family cytochrome c [Melioribacteraceae bacterium]